MSDSDPENDQKYKRFIPTNFSHIRKFLNRADTEGDKIEPTPENPQIQVLAQTLNQLRRNEFYFQFPETIEQAQKQGMSESDISKSVGRVITWSIATSTNIQTHDPEQRNRSIFMTPIDDLKKFVSPEDLQQAAVQGTAQLLFHGDIYLAAQAVQRFELSPTEYQTALNQGVNQILKQLNIAIDQMNYAQINSLSSRLLNLDSYLPEHLLKNNNSSAMKQMINHLLDQPLMKQQENAISFSILSSIALGNRRNYPASPQGYDDITRLKIPQTADYLDCVLATYTAQLKSPSNERNLDLHFVENYIAQLFSRIDWNTREAPDLSQKFQDVIRKYPDLPENIIHTQMAKVFRETNKGYAIPELAESVGMSKAQTSEATRQSIIDTIDKIPLRQATLEEVSQAIKNADYQHLLTPEDRVRLLSYSINHFLPEAGVFMSETATLDYLGKTLRLLLIEDRQQLDNVRNNPEVKAAIEHFSTLSFPGSYDFYKDHKYPGETTVQTIERLLFDPYS